MKLGNVVARWSTAVLRWCADRVSVPISLEGLEFGEADVVPELVASVPGPAPSNGPRPEAAVRTRSSAVDSAGRFVRSGGLVGGVSDTGDEVAGDRIAV